MSYKSRYALLSPVLTLFIVFLASIGAILAPAPAAAQAGEVCVESRISSSSDDAEERMGGFGDGDIYLTNNDLRMIREVFNTDRRMWWGLRFQNVDVPQGATITSAAVEFRASSNSTGATASMTLWGQLASNPTTFTSSDFDISSRSRTSASAAWSVPQWSNNNNYDTSSLTAIVQEIVDQPGWSANNALVIVGRTEADRDRSADSRDGSQNNAPLLKVCYAQEYTLNYSAGTGGSLTGNTNQTVQHGQDGSAVTAVPDTGYHFVEWSDGSTANPRTDTNVTADVDVTANFALDEYTLTVNTTGNGSVDKNPDQATYHYGDVVELTATANPGWTFAGWSGDLSGTGNPADLVMDGNKTVTATFTADEYTLTVNVVGNGSVGKNPDQATYLYSDVVELTATADPGWTFTGWSGDLGGTDNPANLVMDGNKTVTATFTADEYALTVNVVGNGSVGKDPDQATYLYSDVVTLTATADPGWTFTGWSGDLGGTDNPADLVMDANKTVTATFTADEYTLTVNVVGNGSVGKDPDQATYLYSDVVTLTATADPGWTFAGWSGDLGGTDNPADLVMDANKTVTATFTVDEYALTVNVIGDGSVSVDPDQTTYLYGDVVTLTATANLGSGFIGWSGDLGGTDNPANLVMDGDKTVTANFALDSITLKYAAGAGGSLSGITEQTVQYGQSGSAVMAIPDTGYHFVEWSDGSTDNPRTDANVTANVDVTASFALNSFTLNYSAGARGSLSGDTEQTVLYGQDGSAVTAVPDTGYHFVGWSDGSTDNPRTDTNVTANIDVTASFALNEYTLAVNTEGNGSVGIDPDEATHLHGDVVELTATADPGWTFAGWSGDLSGTDNPANLVMDANKTVTATFTAVAPVTCYALTLTHTGQGSDPVASPANSAGCDTGQYVAGEAISLSGAVPASGWEISGWTGTDNDASTAAANSLTMPANAHSVGVTYTETTEPTGDDLFIYVPVILR